MNNKQKKQTGQGKSKKICFIAYPHHTIIKNLKKIATDKKLLSGAIDYLELIINLAVSEIEEIKFSHEWYAKKIKKSVSQVQKIENFWSRLYLIKRYSNGKSAPDHTNPRTVKLSAFILIDWVRRQLRDSFKSLWLSKKNIANLNEKPYRLEKNVIDRYFTQSDSFTFLTSLSHNLPNEHTSSVDTWYEPGNWLSTDQRSSGFL